MKTIGLLIVFIVIAGLGWYSLKEAGERGVNAPGVAADSSRLSELLGDGAVEGYAQAASPRDFHFPEDHGPHAGFRNEWWYVTGNLDAGDGARFGYELTIFRFSLSPDGEAGPDAGWRTNQVYIGHFAITDVETGGFHVAQRFSRGGLGLAGASAVPFRVWVEDWSLSDVPAPGDGWRLRAADGTVALDLTLAPAKPPVMHGIDGLSQKSARPGNASYYYSVTRLETSGSLRAGGREHAVTGRSWLDREWGSSALSREQAGWDWFALQLTDGSDLMFYQIRKIDGTPDRWTSGTWIAADGSSRGLGPNDVRLSATGHWDSPLGGRYPMGWRLQVPGIGLDITVTPVLDAQELAATVRYWEGAVDVSGSRAGQAIGGRGYVEMTGYDRPGS